MPRIGRAELVVCVAHQLDVGADRIADRAHAPDVFLPSARMRGDDHLQLLRAELDLVLGGIDQTVDVVIGKAECHVGFRVVAEAAEQGGDGLAGESCRAHPTSRCRCRRGRRTPRRSWRAD